MGNYGVVASHTITLATRSSVSGEKVTKAVDIETVNPTRPNGSWYISQSVAANDSPIGRAQNRRVELTKQ